MSKEKSPLPVKAHGKFWCVGVAVALLLIGTFTAHPVKGAEKVFRNSPGMEFVLIPSGIFLMGSPPNEAHREASERFHRVSLTKPFYMQTTEVTLGQWRSITGKKGMGPAGAGENVPVSRVSWFDCIQFLEKLNAIGEGSYRLPTEAEWEYACRAGVSDPYPWGTGIDCGRAMFGNHSRRGGPCVSYSRERGLRTDGPAPVKSYPPNAWGLFDMNGNVWEWCRDWYGEYPSTEVQDPEGPGSGTGKIRRGGSWVSPGQACRSANRAFAHPGSRFTSTGFRVVREVR
ncbi:MAG: formylglycine-generating enzyme family protein [Deltaproteobacteria bacterium]|nr:formylglycine-generating enzyme family protein [Deltaproteobacteria bacterium]